jgi:hypothetical protein
LNNLIKASAQESFKFINNIRTKNLTFFFVRILYNLVLVFVGSKKRQI